MTMIRPQVIQLLKSFKDNDNLDALSDAAQLVQQMQIEETASLLDKDSFHNEKMRLHLMVLNEVDGKLIPDFDFDDVPMLSVSPPAESGLPSGVAPSSIADPKMRLKYEKTLFENQKKAVCYSFQKKLMKINKKITEQTEHYMKTELLSKNNGVEALNKLIDDIVSNDRRKVRLKQYIYSTR